LSRKVNKVDSKFALSSAKIPIESISKVPELQLHPLLARILDTAREDIGDEMIGFDYFMKILKVFAPETHPDTKKKLMFRMIDVTGDAIITRREFVLFFVNVFWSRNHFSDLENQGAPRRFTISDHQINQIYQNIDNTLRGVNVTGIGGAEELKQNKGKLKIDKYQTGPEVNINAGPGGQLNADQQLGYEEFDKLVTDQDAYQFLTIDFY
jgi:Ca2+-binding EF-hand superfamily protein